MDSQGGGRKRAVTKTSAEDQALDQIAKEAEARLAARRQARAEARDIRMRELERQQKELEHTADRVYDSVGPEVPSPRGPRLPNTLSRAANLSSRRSSEDSLEDGGSLRDMRLELKELEDKFRKAMIQNAQLDNEKASLGYQLGLLKDHMEDLSESHSQLQREHRDKCRQHDQLKRTNQRLEEDAALAVSQWEDRDRLIANHGLAIAGEGDERCLVSVETANTLASAGQGSLDVRLRRLAEERSDLADQLHRAHLLLSEQRSQSQPSAVSAGAGPAEEEAARESNRLLQEARFRLQKADQDVATLQATVARLESQVVRYKASSESSELAENELKTERRKLQREEAEESNAKDASREGDQEEDEGGENDEKKDEEKKDEDEAGEENVALKDEGDEGKGDTDDEDEKDAEEKVKDEDKDDHDEEKDAEDKEKDGKDDEDKDKDEEEEDETDGADTENDQKDGKDAGDQENPQQGRGNGNDLKRDEIKDEGEDKSKEEEEVKESKEDEKEDRDEKADVEKDDGESSGEEEDEKDDKDGKEDDKTSSGEEEDDEEETTSPSSSSGS